MDAFVKTVLDKTICKGVCFAARRSGCHTVACLLRVSPLSPDPSPCRAAPLADGDKLSRVAIRAAGRFLGILASGAVPGVSEQSRGELRRLIAAEVDGMRRRAARPEQLLAVLEAVALKCPEAAVGVLATAMDLAMDKAPTGKLRSQALDIVTIAASAHTPRGFNAGMCPDWRAILSSRA